MVKFRTLKYKHYREAKKLQAREIAGEDVEEEYLSYAISMVAEWDFIDDDAGEPLPTEASSIDELSLEQVNELSTLFNRKFGDMGAVPKTNAEPSPSTSTPSSQIESPATAQSG